MDKEELDIRDYLPAYYKGFREIDILSEIFFCLLNSLNKEAQQILLNQFVQTSDIRGIERFEKILGIVMDCTKDLEDRRQIILSKLSMSSLFTRRVLEKYLRSICDNGEFKITEDFHNFRLHLDIRVGKKGLVDSIYDTLYMSLPAHLEFYLHNKLPGITNINVSYNLVTQIRKRYAVSNTLRKSIHATATLESGIAVITALRKEGGTIYGT